MASAEPYANLHLDPDNVGVKDNLIFTGRMLFLMPNQLKIIFSECSSFCLNDLLPEQCDYVIFNSCIPHTVSILVILLTHT